MIKKRFSLALAVILVLTLFAGCGGSAQPAGTQTAATSSVKPAIVLTSSGKGDKSFNDSALLGLDRAKADLGTEYKEITPKDVADLEKSIEFLAKEKYSPIFCIGFTSANALTAVADKYPNTQFVIIDYNYGEEIKPNVKGIVFKEEEGSYLAGALAASLSESGTIGFVGGMESPLIQKFEVGYKAGAEAVNPSINVLISYVSADSSGFNNPSRAKEIALDMVTKKADLIYQAAGGSGIGVLEAAEEKGFLAIGVDSNQNWVKPGTVVASMLKRVDNAVYETVKSASEGNLETGLTQVFDLSVGGVGLTDLKGLSAEETEGISADDQAKIQAVKDRISDETRQKIDELSKGIIDKSITVPSTR